MTETEGQKTFRRMVAWGLQNLCINCGRVRNKQGNYCCRMCRDRYAGHSKLCRQNNGD